MRVKRRIFLKKIIAFTLAILLLIEFPSPVMAYDYAGEMNNIIKYYKQYNTINNTDEALALASVGVDIRNFKINYIDRKLLNSEKTRLVSAIRLSYEAFSLNKNPRNYIENVDLIEIVKYCQKNDGSFGSLHNTVDCIIILESIKEKFNKSGALEYLLRFQNNDGGFKLGMPYKSDLMTTSKVLSVLSYYNEKENIKVAKQMALDYIKSEIATTQRGIPFEYQNTIILSDILRAYKDSNINITNPEYKYIWDIIVSNRIQDGFYKSNIKNTNEFDGLATAKTLVAYDLAGSKESYIKRLMLTGKLYKSSTKEYLWIIMLMYLIVMSALIFILIKTKQYYERDGNKNE